MTDLKARKRAETAGRTAESATALLYRLRGFAILSSPTEDPRRRDRPRRAARTARRLRRGEAPADEGCGARIGHREGAAPDRGRGVLVACEVPGLWRIHAAVRRRRVVALAAAADRDQRLRCRPRQDVKNDIARRRPDGPDREDLDQGGFHLRAHAGSAGARPRDDLLHAGHARHARRPGVGGARAGLGARGPGRPLHAGRSGAAGAHRRRRDPDAPGPALRHALHLGDAPSRARPSADAGGQRPRPCAQRAGEALRHRIPRPDAADADHPRQGRDRGLPQGVRRHRHEAALRQWRRRRCSG